MSNPVRQSLYTFEDSLNGGEMKAVAAPKNLKRIFPIVEAEDTRKSRWLPTLLCAYENKVAITAALGFDSYLVMGHGAYPVSSDMYNTCTSSENVEDINGVAGQIHTLSAKYEKEESRLGCYFYNDVVGPLNSTSSRTLDQQCTVTRPGLAPIASSFALELLVGILHHLKGINAPGKTANSNIDSSDRPLGILPHQMRGSLHQYSPLTL